MKSCLNPSRHRAGLLGALLALVLLFSGLFLPAKSYAVTSGPGVWDLMVFGNYDLLSPNTGSIYTNLPAGQANSNWNNTYNNGYGGGVGIAYWFNDVVAFRVEAQTSLFTDKSPLTGSIQSSPLTGGFEVKLVGDPEYYLYAVADGGVAYEATMSGQNWFGKSSNNSWSTYADAGLGFNFSWVFVEAKIAYLPESLPGAGLSGTGQNALWYVPVTAGFNF